jgi:hypothetical protein
MRHQRLIGFLMQRKVPAMIRTCSKLFRIVGFALVLNCALSCRAFSQQLAVTIDDLPSHGTLPPGMTRTDVARSILKALNDAHVPKVYGFVNAKKLE